MFKQIVKWLGLLVVSAILYIATIPYHFQIKEELLIHATPDVVFNQIRDTNRVNSILAVEDSREMSPVQSFQLIEEIPVQFLRFESKPPDESAADASSKLLSVQLLAADKSTKVIYELKGNHSILSKLVEKFRNMERQLSIQAAQVFLSLKTQIEGT